MATLMMRYLLVVNCLISCSVHGIVMRVVLIEHAGLFIGTIVEGRRRRPRLLVAVYDSLSRSGVHAVGVILSIHLESRGHYRHLSKPRRSLVRAIVSHGVECVILKSSSRL